MLQNDNRLLHLVCLLNSYQGLPACALCNEEEVTKKIREVAKTLYSESGSATPPSNYKELCATVHRICFLNKDPCGECKEPMNAFKAELVARHERREAAILAFKVVMAVMILAFMLGQAERY